MKKEAQNTLIIITIIAITLSVLSFSLSITKMMTTGAGVGYINVTVSSVVDITIGTNSINFTEASPGETRNSYNASEVYNCGADNHCGFNITNDGNRFANITIQETEALFDSASFSATKHLTYNITMQDLDYATGYSGKNNCSTGYDLGLKGQDDSGQTGQWRAIPRTDSEVAICYLNCTDEPPDGNQDNRPDTARVELNITVPDDETTGSKVGTITFVGSST